MASTDFLKAVEEIGYMENPYTSKNLLSLDHSIDLVTRDLADDVFGESNTLKKDEWLKIAHFPELAFIFSFESIREKIH